MQVLRLVLGTALLAGAVLAATCPPNYCAMYYSSCVGHPNGPQDCAPSQIFVPRSSFCACCNDCKTPIPAGGSCTPVAVGGPTVPTACRPPSQCRLGVCS